MRGRKKVILYGVIFFFPFYLFNKLSQAVRLDPGTDFFGKIVHIKDGFAQAFENILVSFDQTDLLVGLAGVAALVILILIRKGSAKKYRQ